MTQPMPDPGDELIAIVDRQDVVVGSTTRRDMRAQKLIHRAAYVLVFNQQDHLFIQKRTTIKDVYPGLWDIAAGGVVLAGESYEEAALRELAEELGVQDSPLTYLFDQYFEDASNRVWGRTFSCVSEGPFTLQEEEIEYGRFISLDMIEPLHRREPFTPDSIPLLQKVRAARG